jgi:hypothetical protein
VDQNGSKPISAQSLDSDIRPPSSRPYGRLASHLLF